MNVNSFPAQTVNLEVDHPKVVAYQKQMQVFPRVEVPLVFYCLNLKRSIDTVIIIYTLFKLSNHHSWLGAALGLTLLVVV